MSASASPSPKMPEGAAVAIKEALAAKKQRPNSIEQFGMSFRLDNKLQISKL